MRITISVLKADVGSIGGHTLPSPAMLAAAREEIQRGIASGVLLDGFVSHTGDDIALIMSHERGNDSTAVHQLAWRAFQNATAVAAEAGLYGAGQDLLVDAPSGNLRGAGPAVAELTFEHNPVKTNKVRASESFCVFAADKCGPGAYNLPLFLSFADPMYSAGLMLPKLSKGFRFKIVDMDNTEGDSVIELNAPEDYYQITALLRDNERFGIAEIHARGFEHQPAAAVSTQRLHNIAGTYTGKDDPIAIVRNQGIFPAPEEILSTFAKAHYVGGGARGSHVMPLMPVALNTAVTGLYCIPLVSCVGFSLNGIGQFSGNSVDFFNNTAWDIVRHRAQEKGIALREQGWSGASMLPYTELEYGGFRDTVEGLLSRFRFEHKTPHVVPKK
ncbi:MAG: fructose 1,6-bisphosphatase [Patescibacteria group bacterium]|nr:fructose 1,6-bisphosphatase [Patescibacteria group bacterium]